MPLDLKSLPDNHEHEIEPGDQSYLADSIRREVGHATRKLEHQAEQDHARLLRQSLHASKRVIKTGRRVVRSANTAPFPLTPIALGIGIILAAVLINRNSDNH